MSLWAELKRRNVIRVGAAYLVASWLLVEASAVALEAFGAPDWVPRAVAVLLVLGFPIALFFAWAFEVTPEGIKRESEVDRTQSITPHTGRRLDILTLVMLAVVVALVLVDRFVLEAPTAQPVAEVHAGPVSIAVLPFTNMSTDAENEYFADGISEEILNLLADVRDLSVASRTSAFAFKGSNASIPDIATSLGVRYVLEGSVRKSGNQVRVTAQLIDSANDRHLWSETYDRVLDDIFTIQDEIAGSIGRALRVELLGERGQRVSAEQIDADVYAAFLEGRYLLRRRNNEDVASALGRLRSVVEAESGFAPGHVILAETYLLNYLLRTGAVEPAEALSLTRSHAERARELNPDLGGIYLALGMLAQLDDQDFRQGLEHYGRAIELEPDEPRPYHWRAITLGQAGLLERALDDIGVAYRLEPENANVNGEFAEILVAIGDYERASEFLDRQARYGNVEVSHRNRFVLELMRGDLAAAERVAVAGSQPEETRALMLAALATIHDPSARPALRELVRGIDDWEGWVASVLLVAGEEELWMQSMGLTTRVGPVYLQWHSRFAAMRASPHFVPGLERLGLTGVWQAMGPPADCRAEGDTFVCGLGESR